MNSTRVDYSAPRCRVIIDIQRIVDLQMENERLQDMIRELQRQLNILQDELNKSNHRFEKRSRIEDDRNLLERLSKKELIDRIFALSQSNQALTEENRELHTNNTQMNRIIYQLQQIQHGETA